MARRNTLIRDATAGGQSRKAPWGRMAGGQVLAQQSSKGAAYTHPTPYVRTTSTQTERVSRERGCWVPGLWVPDRVRSSSPPCLSLPGESDARLMPPPGHGHHHKVLIHETWQADEETPSSLRGWGLWGGRGATMGHHACKATERPATEEGGWTRGKQTNPHGHTHCPAHAGHTTSS